MGKMLGFSISMFAENSEVLMYNRICPACSSFPLLYANLRLVDVVPKRLKGTKV